MTQYNQRLMSSFTGFARGAWGAYQALETLEAQRRARQQEKRVNQSLLEAERVRRFVENPDASGLLGDGRLGTLEDAAAEGMLDPQGLFLGGLEGEPLFYNGDAHLLNYALTRSGKGRDIVLPNLAHVFNRSLVVNDIKDGENAYASADHRKANGHRIIAINPHGLLNAPSFKLNPFQRIINKGARGESITEDSLQLCMSLVPPIQGEGKWVAAGSKGSSAPKINGVLMKASSSRRYGTFDQIHRLPLSPKTQTLILKQCAKRKQRSISWPIPICSKRRRGGFRSQCRP